jgi:hypothetical protein
VAMLSIPDKEVVLRLKAESPWWGPPHTVGPQFAELRPRAYLPPFLALVRERSVRRAVVLLGPRRVGKTVLIHHAVKTLLEAGVPPRSLAYISVDLPLYNGLSLERMLVLAEQASGEPLAWVFFDEIQYLSNWEVHLKRLVDDRPDLKIVVSGSAAAALRIKSQESGAGRFTEFLLPPLTFAEYLDLTGSAEPPRRTGPADQLAVSDIDSLNAAFVEYANYGGYPEAALSAVVRADPMRFIKSDIVDKVLLRDLPQLYGIGDIQELNRLFTALAWNTAQELSLDTLSTGSGVAKNTLKKYVEYLEARGQLQGVPDQPVSPVGTLCAARCRRRSHGSSGRDGRGGAVVPRPGADSVCPLGRGGSGPGAARPRGPAGMGGRGQVERPICWGAGRAQGAAPLCQGEPPAYRDRDHKNPVCRASGRWNRHPDAADQRLCLERWSRAAVGPGGRCHTLMRAPSPQPSQGDPLRSWVVHPSGR